MKKSFKRGALCIALAAAMVFGEAGTVMAAGGQNTVAAVETSAEASVASTSLSIDKFEINMNYGISIEAAGAGYKAVLKINGKNYYTAYSYGSGSWSMYTTFYEAVQGGTYQFEIVAYDEKGNKISKKSGKKTVAYQKFYNSSSFAYTNTGTTANGYKKIEDVYVYQGMDSYMATNVSYEVYRSKNKNSGYKKIGSGKSSGSSLSYTDKTAKYGTTYYYKFCIVVAKDKYISKKKTLATSAPIEASVKSKAYISLERNGSFVDLTVKNYSVSNSFDIYRSASKNSGFKKIATTYTDVYTDKTVELGNTYYYKVIPKYYDSKTGKTYVETKTDPEGIELEMGDFDPDETSLKQISSTVVKAEWNKLQGADIYEVWYKSDISGELYKKVGTTKSTSYTIRNLDKFSTSHHVLIKAQKRSDGKTISEKSWNMEIYSGNDGFVENLRAVSIKTSLSKSKKTLTVATRLKWDKVPGASGYLITAENRNTGNMDVIKKIRNANTTTCVVKNVASVGKSAKYSSVRVVSYKGKEVTTDSYNSESVDRMPYASGVKVSRKSGAAARITWKSVPGADKYTVYRTMPVTKSDVEYAKVGETTKNYFVDKTVGVAAEYKYLIVSETEKFSGLYNLYSYNSLEDYTEASISKTYIHKVSTPKIKSVKNNAKKTVTVKWNKISNATYYIVYRSTSKNGKYTRVGAVKGNLSYTDKKVKKGKTYYYKITVKAINDGGVATTTKASTPVKVKVKK